MKHNAYDLRIYQIALILAVLIYVQQVLVINIGASLKLYEVMALLLMIFTLIAGKIVIYGKYSFLLFWFFVIAPIVGNIVLLYDTSHLGYYKRFPEAVDSLRFNHIFAPVAVYIYYLLNWFVINSIAGNKLIYLHRARVIKVFVMAGVVVSLYSLYAMIFVSRYGFPDLVPDFIDYRNSRPIDYPLRTMGLSNEPGQFVPLLVWCVLYAWFLKDILSSFHRWAVIAICSSALIFTFSSVLIIPIITLIVFVLLFDNIIKKLNILSVIIIISMPVYLALEYFDLIGLVEYAYISKIDEFLNPALYEHTPWSGVQRAYSSALGVELFKEFPLFGVGGGNSYFHIWKYEFSLPFYVDMLTHSVPPQNSHIKILAELGLFGYLLFLTFFLVILYRAIKRYKITNDVELKIYIIGTISTFGFFITIFPEYSLFMWFNIALFVNKVYQEKI